MLTSNTATRRAATMRWRRGLAALAALLALHQSHAPAWAGILYVGEPNQVAIVTYDTSAAVPTPTIFADSADGVGNTQGLAFDAAGNLYVANAANNTIEKFTPDGTGSVFISTDLNSPSGLAFDAAGNLYVADHGDNKIFGFDSTGAKIYESAFNELVSPRGLAFDKAGNLFVALDVLHMIYEITPGNSLIEFAVTADGNGRNDPFGLAFDTDGNLYASYEDTNIIEKFTSGGVGSDFATTGLNNPLGLAFDTGGNLFVANQSGGTIEKFTPDGAGTVFANTFPFAPTALAFGPPSQPQSVPEPSSMVMLGIGIAGLIGFRRTRARTRRFGRNGFAPRGEGQSK